jgi:hypothetical protein
MQQVSGCAIVIALDIDASRFNEVGDQSEIREVAPTGQQQRSTRKPMQALHVGQDRPMMIAADPLCAGKAHD